MYANRPNIKPNMEHVNKINSDIIKKPSCRSVSFEEDNNDTPKEPSHENVSVEELVNGSLKPIDFMFNLCELLSFWDKPDAQSLDSGLFTTFLTNEGKQLPESEADWPEEYKLAKNDCDIWNLIDLKHNYIRAHSRQTFAYGIAFHMTGISTYLNLCYKGAMALVNAMDDNFGMHTLQKVSDKKFVENRKERDSQDLAYGLTGLGMYYFLTHDEGILHRIIQLKDYIFDKYFDEGKGIFTWLQADLPDNGDKEIVAQLDQLYAYMLMLTPALPEPYKSIWKKDLKKIADILIQQFYSQEYEFFWGEEKDFKSLTLGKEHTDFGHSVKTFWVIYKVGEILEDMSYINFARPHIDKILKMAYIEETVEGTDIKGTWGRRLNADSTIDKDKEWWILAELDQACEILALNDPSYLRYLNNTQRYWKKFMIDQKDGEVWHMVSGKDHAPMKQFPKVHKWKTALHSFETTLFGYMTSCIFNSENIRAFYAFYDEKSIPYEDLAPYMFRGKIKDVTLATDPHFLPEKILPPERHIYQVYYNCIH